MHSRSQVGAGGGRHMCNKHQMIRQNFEACVVGAKIAA